MAYPWQTTSVWPIPAGTEIKASHFEDLRMMIYLLRFPNAGKMDYDYASPLRNTTWEDWVEDNFAATSDTSSDYDFEGSGLSYRRSAFSNNLFNIVFRSSAGESADLYSCKFNGYFVNRAMLKANPPVFSNGTFNSTYWCYAVDIDRYHDLDRHSGRYIVKTYTASSLDTYLSVFEGYRYLPVQVGRDYQRKHIKYNDTQREIISLPPGGRELTSADMTETSSMGPILEIYGENSVYGSLVRRKTPMDQGDAEQLPVAGENYAVVMPWLDPAENWPNPGENQVGCDTKLCDAYQNHVEQVIEAGYFMVKIGSATSHGQDYIRNYNEKKFVGVPTWPSYSGDAGNGYYSRYNGGFWYNPTSSSGPPSEENGWVRVDWGYRDKLSDPLFAFVADELWGCNKSSFELALKIMGNTNHDWYYCDSYNYTPDNVLHARVDLFDDAVDEVIVNALYPESHGTWHRTHRYTFGRPKSSTLMRPGTEAPDVYLYTDYQEESGEYTPTPQWWSGYYIPAAEVPSNESDYLTESQINQLHDRHEPSLPDTSQYEQMRQMMNDLWELLEVFNLVYIDSYVSVVNRSSDETTATFVNSNDAYQSGLTSARAAVESATWGSIGLGGLLGEEVVLTAEWDSGAGIYKWRARAFHRDARFKVTVSSQDISKIRATTIWVYLKVLATALGRPGSATDVPPNKLLPYNLGVTLDEIAAIPNWDLTDCYDGYDFDPDLAPEGYYDWFTETHQDCKTTLIAIDIGNMTYDAVEGCWYLPIPSVTGLPTSIANYPVLATPPPVPYYNYVQAISRGDLEMLANSQFCFTIEKDGSGIDFASKSYRTFTAIAVDDELFGVDGYPD